MAYAFWRLRFLYYLGCGQKYAQNELSLMIRLMLGTHIHSFSVGLDGSPDLAAAQIVADHIGTIHHEIKFTIQEGLDAIKESSTTLKLMM
jgi:asparagine synthetase B (glutamine-hydrolysing)